ncbi:ferredoxin [Anaerosinus massiliensis]|uniref:ferredoxin n=1 Tax=Massilibacillus massiliensis TaxID=1806837 RepID=UPI000DA62379|nr:ferredoxin [Massilibacillus massiliensis]
MKGFVDKEICIGCGMCPGICPEIFAMDDDDGKAIGLDKEITNDLFESAEDARDQCPVSAISLE